MATQSTLLCIHRDPAQLGLLQENGYELLTATNGHEGLRLFMSRPVDAIVLEYHLGLLDGGIIAAEIKKVNPQVPIVMLTDYLELPDGAWNSVDALVIKSDGPHFLLATVHFVLNVKPTEPRRDGLAALSPALLHRAGWSRQETSPPQAKRSPSALDENNAPFSPGVWKNIRDGTIQF
jgi:DNA-binding response OmpR family regulator